jgi:GNAT superfamily N-acetyltransferase
MQDDWFKTVKLPISFDEFHQLPRNAAYKYEYFDGTAWLSPRPKSYHGLLKLSPGEPVTRLKAQHDSILIRPIEEADWEDLIPTFSGAFDRVCPFSAMDRGEERKSAARKCLEKTRSGGDGPLIPSATFVAVLEKKPQRTLGAILVSLAPKKDLSEFDAMEWRDDAPKDAIGQRLGRPWLVWIFVAPLFAGRGIGTALLSNAVHALRELGYEELASCFLSGNDSSMLWHWRNGFELQEYAGSLRRIDRQIREGSFFQKEAAE